MLLKLVIKANWTLSSNTFKREKEREKRTKNPAVFIFMIKVSFNKKLSFLLFLSSQLASGKWKKNYRFFTALNLNSRNLIKFNKLLCHLSHWKWKHKFLSRSLHDEISCRFLIYLNFLNDAKLIYDAIYLSHAFCVFHLFRRKQVTQDITLRKRKELRAWMSFENNDMTLNAIWRQKVLQKVI